MGYKIKVMETAPQQPKRNLDISQICDPNEQWEKVAQYKGHIEGMNFDREGRMWIVSTPLGQVLKIEDGEPIVVGPSEGGPNGMAIHKDGRIFVCDKFGELYWVDPDDGSRHLVANSYRRGHFSGLNDCIFDTKGGLYFTEPYGSTATIPNGRVFYLPPDGKQNDIVLLHENIAFPNGICCAPNDEVLYIAEFAKNRILYAQCVPPYNPSDPTHVFCTYEGGVGPDGIAIDGDGNLYCAHFGATEVAVVDKEGFHYGSIRMPAGLGVHSDNLAFNDGYLYVEEGISNTIWRIKVKVTMPTLYSDM